MLEKLLAVLPYNPGLSHQVAFYGRRMREESSIRRTGMIFIILAFFIQFFAVLAPPKPTLAGSTNDLINGGISSPHEAAVACHDNTRHYGDILAYYGIPCGDLNGAPVINIHAHDFNNQLFSLGNNPYGKPGETPVNISGNTVFWRYLWGWPYGTAPIKVAKVVEHGVTFFIMFDCGNLVSIGLPQPFSPPVAIGPAQPVPTPPVAISPNRPVTKPTPTPTPTPPPPTPTPPPTPCQYDSSITADNSSCKPCEQSISSQDTTACIAIHKTAADTTQNVSDANNTTAQPGDVIVYTLYAKNNGKATVKDYVFQEVLSDVLDYADVTDLHGGTMDSNGNVTWAASDIKAGSTATVQITVKVKDPVPQNPVSPSNPGHFDLTMTNVYGNTINIKVPGSPAKTVEVAAATLPNTGPGTNLFIASAIVIIGGYFYGRSRLLAKESNLALQESTGA